MQNHSETLAISSDDKGLNFFIHRKDPNNREIILQTMILNKDETIVLLKGLFGMPELSDEAIAFLYAKGLVRLNHN